MFGKTNRYLTANIESPSAFWKKGNLRSLVKIASIDDEPFQPYSNLRNLKYEISELGDIKDVDEVSDYSIVLCDLMGVGTFLDAEDQGASIIREIRRTYPSIFVIAYTGSSMGSKQARKAREVADHILKKDASIEQWQAVLDRYIDLSARPDVLWLRTRKALIEDNVDTLDILKIERAYVKGVMKKDGEFFSYKSVIEGVDVKGTSKAVLVNLVSAGILAAIGL